ncbi:MAG: ABC transporter permease [Chloroflexota bacterium]|nr:ABC transporter permease [Chloroflexota bacterium]MQG37485.1 ABC transporter permease [SAR202 cluster bacterium]|tara:strand:+ start:397 stop:1380 length:984 start_codon:yes stop_codon:yes gene_type:complete
MWVFLAKRIGIGLITIWALSLFSFILIQLPKGDYVTSEMIALQMEGENVTDEELENLRIYFGLDKPVHMQYLSWIGNMMRGNLGYSYAQRTPVNDILGQRLLLTVLYAAATVVFIWVVAIPIGILSAVKQYSFADYSFTTLGFIGVAVPDFLLALLFLWLGFVFFGVSMGGLFSPEFVDAPWNLARIWDLTKHLFIPIIVLGTSGTASLIRIVRANLLDELHKPYVVAARARGLREWRLILKYPVRLALNPAVSLTAYIFPFLISGSVIVSVVLSLPTIGPTLLQSLLEQDLQLAGAIIFLAGVMTVVGTLISDILLGLLDPRIRQA